MAKKSKLDISGKRFAFFGGFAYWPAHHGGPPEAVVRRLGGVVNERVDDDLDFVVFGDKRGPGRADAKKKAERITANRKAKLRILSEEEFRDLVQIDVRGKRFAFAGGFDCAPSGFEDGLLAGMVESVGGVVHRDVDGELDYLVLGNRRAAGKTAAERRGRDLLAEHGKLAILDEAGFLDLVRVELPSTGAMDFAALMGRLHTTVNPGKLRRAMAMLKAESFKLYARVDDALVVGVVRSQTGYGTVYSSWLRPDGRYGCATPELEECMGLQGNPCKHLMVLVVGLARAGELSPDVAARWMAAAQSKRPSQDTELAAETFVQYKGAEAGEIDWRPTETIPEDFLQF